MASPDGEDLQRSRTLPRRRPVTDDVAKDTMPATWRRTCATAGATLPPSPRGAAARGSASSDNPVPACRRGRHRPGRGRSSGALRASSAEGQPHRHVSDITCLPLRPLELPTSIATGPSRSGRVERAKEVNLVALEFSRRGLAEAPTAPGHRRSRATSIDPAAGLRDRHRCGWCHPLPSTIGPRAHPSIGTRALTHSR